MQPRGERIHFEPHPSSAIRPLRHNRSVPKVPFQRLAVVRLISPEAPVPDTPEDDAIQAAHMAYLGDLVARGIILANGPVKRKDDTRIRGLSLYLVGVDEAREYAKADPAVQNGWFEVLADEWLIPVRPRTIADVADMEIDLPD